MEDFDDREYNSVILGALLHDVGKLLHRGDKEYKYADGHEVASAQFITKFLKRLRNDVLYDVDLIELLVRCHDTGITKDAALKLSQPYLRGKADELPERTWKLIKLIRKADSYSCAERDIEKNVFAQRTLPLESAFSYITLGQAQRNRGRYHLAPFKPVGDFPLPFSELEDSEITDIISQFEASIPDFTSFTSIEDVFNAWLNILHEYMWAVPSDTRYKNGISDISLFDHLRSCAAIAACLYKRHIATLAPGQRFTHIDEIILIGGDFSGIQNYIFDITNKGSGGASKRLRARSFFIYLFTEAAIHKILHALKLPMVCNIFSAGGKFLLFAPDISGIESGLAEIKTEIEKEIHETYFSQFAFMMSWIRIEVFREKMGVSDFFTTAVKMFHALEREKIVKSQNALIKDHRWNTEAFKASKLYESYKSNGDCPICGRGPATHKEDKDDEGRVVMSCFLCYRDKIFIGQKIPRCNYIAFAKGPVTLNDKEQGKKIVLFHDKRDGHESNECYYVELLDRHSYNQDYYLVYNVGQTNDQYSSARKVPLKKYYANYVLLDPGKKVETFENLAKLSHREKNDVKHGSDLLGVLKADVDNLGLLFNKGFEISSPEEKGLPAGDRKTVSRFLTLSRMFELFFSGWMKEIMSKDHKAEVVEELSGIEGIHKTRFTKYLEGNQINFENIYTVYSGGDDLVLVGPWETMIIFAIYMNQQFKKYTCNNDDITLSAGLSFIKPKQPISWGIRKADELLNQSKERGKDRITLFGTTVKWGMIPELLDAFLFFDEKLNDSNSNINLAFLYRLLGYHQTALKYFDDKQKNIAGLRYISALNYDIGRNIVEWDKDGNKKKGADEFSFLQKLIHDEPSDKSLMSKMKIPLFWSIYRHRKPGTASDANRKERS